MRNNQRGQAYLLVLILMLSVFIMLSLAMYISGYEVQVSSYYHNSSNLYLMAVSGAEAGAALINKTGLSAHPALAAAARKEIFKEDGDISSYAEYRILSPSLAYEGSFHLKEKDERGLKGEADVLFQRIYGSLAAQYLQAEFDKLLPKRGDAYYFSYEVNEYRIMVDITIEDASYDITSIALSEDGKNKSVVEARVMCDFGGHDEILAASYEWQTPPIWSAYALYGGGNIQIQGENITVESTFEEGEWKAGQEVPFTETFWTLDNPIVFTDGRQGSFIIGDFYSPQTGVPVYTAIYSKGDLILESDNPGRNQFNGLAAAHGNIILRDVQLKGNILAGGDIVLEQIHSEKMEMQKDTDAVFKVRSKDKAAERKLYDLLGMTDFRNAEDLSITGVRLGDMLKHIAISKDSGMEVLNTEGPLFKIVSLREIR